MSTSNIDWSNCEAILHEFDDGHVPENLESTQSAKLVDYSLFHEREARVNVYQDAFDPAILDAVYQKTVDDKTWGDYVTIEQIKDCWENDSESLVVRITARYIQLCLGTENMPCHSFGDSEAETLFCRKDLEKAHGVAVWGLAADVGSCVPFHLDYAEQIRYSSNIIVPPLLAGTLQCTRDTIEGGDFYVSLKGIPDYRIHGYKSKLKKLDLNESNFVTVPYRFNQITCFLGNLPHGSTKIDKIHGSQKRTIVGFNVCCMISGPVVMQAPEHSSKFRRKVQVEKLLSRNMTLNRIKNNKPLAKLLVLAKRKKIKDDFRRAQEKLGKEIPGLLPCRVQDLIDRFCSKTASQWPVSPADLQVYLYHQIVDGKYRIHIDGRHIGGTKDRIDEMVSPLATLGLPDERS